MVTFQQSFFIDRRKCCRRRRDKVIALSGSSRRKGIVYKVAIITPRKPNSAKRKIVKMRVLFNKRRIFAKIPGQGHNLREHSLVMFRGGSPRDSPGVNYTLIRNCLDFTGKETFVRRNRLSRYGYKTSEKT